MPNTVSINSIREYSHLDEEIIKVKQDIFRDNCDSLINNFKTDHTELCFYGGILLRSDKIVISSQLRPEIWKAAHEDHPGIVGMKHRLRTKVWWPKIYIDAEKMVKARKGCTLVTGPNPPNRMKRRELPTQAWVAVAADILD